MKPLAYVIFLRLFLTCSRLLSWLSRIAQMNQAALIFGNVKLVEGNCHLTGLSSNRSLPHWYKSALFNELYFISDGGTVWVESVEEFPHGVRHKHTWSHELVREYGRFGYLEGR